MAGIIPLDEGALHEAILRRSESGVRGSGSQPGSREPGGTARPALRPVCEEHRWTRKRGPRRKPVFTQALPEARSPSSKTPQWSAGRRRALRGAHFELPKRRVGAPPPSFRGTEERTKGGPVPSFTGRRSVGFACLSAVTGGVDLISLRPENCTRDGVEATIMLKNRASGFSPGVQTGECIMAG